MEPVEPARTPRLGTALLLLAATVAGGTAALRAAQRPEEPAGRFGDTVEVRLVTLPIRVVDTGGNPILGLGPEDLRVRVDRREVPVVGLDWVGTAVERPQRRAAPGAGRTAPGSPAPSSAPSARTDAATEAALAEGRLIVVFVQADLTPSRISGQMRLRPHTRELLAALRPGDRVAVVSFDSHLKLWQDFAQDVEATHAAIDRALVFNPEGRVERARPLSLLAGWDRRAAYDAASPEKALEVVGRALAPLPGEKVLIFLGWGLGRFGATGVTMTPDFAPAVHALREARTSVFVLDVTSADAHSLAAGLEGVAQSTGGQSFATFRLPATATRTLTRTIAGHYVLTLDAGAIGDGGVVRIDLRGRVGTVLHRPLALR